MKEQEPRSLRNRVLGAIVAFAGTVAAGLIVVYLTPWVQSGPAAPPESGPGASSPSQPSPPPATAGARSAIRLTAEGDSPQSAALASEVRRSVAERLGSEGEFEDMSIDLVLSQLDLSHPTQRAVTLSWVVAAGGEREVRCPARPVRFYSTQNLAETVAEELQGSITASHREGGLACD